VCCVVILVARFSNIFFIVLKELLEFYLFVCFDMMQLY
jgi:hypothetical protein